MNNIYGVILGAGEGTRMKSCLPKVLHKVAGKELISHVIDCLNHVKLQKLFVVIGSGSDLVLKHLKRFDENLNITTALQEKRLGSGHALLQIKKYAEGLKGHLIVMCGDTPLVRQETIKQLLQYHIKNKNFATILSGIVNEPFGYGRIVRDSNGNVSCIIEEKSASQEQKQIKEINSGIYCFDLETLWQALSKVKNDNNKKEYYLTDVISILNKSGYKTDALSITNEEEILGINDRKQLAYASKILRNRKLDKLMSDGITIIDPTTTYIDNDVIIGQDTVIKPNTSIEGKVKIGKNCQIGPNTCICNSLIGDDTIILYSYVDGSNIKNNVKIGPFSHIRPDSILKDNVKVGNFSEVKKSVIDKGSKVNHLSYIGDAIIGKDVNIGAGTITCNYDGNNKHQTIIQDEVFVGSNVNLVAPVKIGKKVLIAAGSTITENVLPNKLTIARARQIIKVRKKK
ncbi:MAG: bifunctional UDP-N-acetylglucosamine diphosphorylase/glucosamine-1-phosphate N-acetyltransferase GlmU [Endomicrobiia bacterium]|nr:bifunctional UDP-N-acetylglucosamine diphosphorylase/glucosamine-1-phosphate N-acetyltransferase GlmU [Endomicrobiaceae bacterium]MDD3053098.1 bifunctional UDP-N-acetylglucosamine diphosphorylase/glucosamine-1-phosphate N-acetyltransferase GlmU [Endomicrobiaceae bacterium]